MQDLLSMSVATVSTHAFCAQMAWKRQGKMYIVDRTNLYAAIVQPVEYTHGKGEITGSIPVRG